MTSHTFSASCTANKTVFVCPACLCDGGHPGTCARLQHAIHCRTRVCQGTVTKTEKNNVVTVKGFISVWTPTITLTSTTLMPHGYVSVTFTTRTVPWLKLTSSYLELRKRQYAPMDPVSPLLGMEWGSVWSGHVWTYLGCGFILNIPRMSHQHL